MDNYLKQVPLTHRVMGYRQVVRGINSNQIRCVLIASDVDSNIRSKIVWLCEQKNVPFSFSLDKATMGKMLELDVACAICAESIASK